MPLYSFGGGSDSNFANTDLTLTGNRIHDLNGNSLTIEGNLGNDIFQIDSTGKFFLGSLATTTDNTNVAVGTRASATASYSMGLGHRASAPFSESIMLNANSATRSTDAANTFAVHVGGGSTNILYLSKVNDSYITIPYNFGLGITTPTARWHVKGTGSTSATKSLIVENSLGTDLFKIDDSGGFALGSGAAYSNNQNVSIGLNATATGVSSISIGEGATSTNTNTISIGASATVASTNGISIGGLSDANDGVAIGKSSQALNTESIAIGNGANANAYNGVCIGANTSVTAGRGTAIGSNASVTANRGLSIGYLSSVGGIYSTMISSANTAKANNVANSFAVNCNSTDHLFFIGNTADGWLNSTGNFGIGLTTGISEKLHVSGNVKVDGQVYSTQGSTITVTANASTFDGNNGNNQPLDLAAATADITLTFTNLKAGSFYFIKVIQKASSPVNIGTWTVSGGVCKSPSPITISTGANSIDTLVCYYDGTDVLINVAQDYQTI